MVRDLNYSCHKNNKKNRPTIFSCPKSFLGPKLFWDQRYFQTQNILGPKIYFGPKFCFSPNIFSGQKFFSDKTFFLTQKINFNERQSLEGEKRASLIKAFLNCQGQSFFENVSQFFFVI